MGGYREVEICEPAGSVLLHQPRQKFVKTDISFGIGITQNIRGP